MPKETAPTAVEELIAQAAANADMPDDDIGALHALLTEQMRETLSGSVTDADLALADEINTARLALETAAEERITAQADRDQRAADLLASITPTEPEPEPEGEPEPELPETEVEVEVEAPVADITPEPVVEEAPVVERIAASAEPEVNSVVTRVAARRPEIRRAVRASAPAPHTVLRASAGGQPLATREKRAEAFVNAFRDTESMERGRRVRVASLGAIDDFETENLYGEDRFLDDNPHRNQRKVEAVTGLSALRASGGVCAPSPFNYDQGVLGTTDRPVRDGLARYGADRGGVQLIAPPHLNDAAVTAGITTWTNANDISPSSPTTKNVTTIDCGTPVTTTVDAIVEIAKIGNYQGRYFRERVDAFMQKLHQQAARTAETKLLTAIGAGSTQVADQTVLGTSRDVLTHLDQHAAQIRYRDRLAKDYPFRVMLPDWLLDNMRSDLAREQPGAAAERLAMSEAQIEEFFTVRNFNVTWFLDGETGQGFPNAQTDGAAIGWPSRVVGYIFAEGEWLYLDGGGLDLGVVRDSTLNGTNDYEIFSEFFENVARTNVSKSYRLDMDICPTGATSLPITTAAVCTSGS